MSGLGIGTETPVGTSQRASEGKVAVKGNETGATGGRSRSYRDKGKVVGWNYLREGRRTLQGGVDGKGGYRLRIVRR